MLRKEEEAEAPVEVPLVEIVKGKLICLNGSQENSTGPLAMRRKSCPKT